LPLVVQPSGADRTRAFRFAGSRTVEECENWGVGFVVRGLRRGCVVLIGVAVFETSVGAQAQEAEDGASLNVAASESEGYPVAYIERPLTLPALMAEAAVGAGYWWVEEEENVANTSVSGTLGLTDWWEVRVRTRFNLAPEDGWNQVVGVGTSFRAIDTDRFDLAPGLSVPVVFDNDRSTEAVPIVRVDALARIRVFRRLALYVGNDVVPIGLGDNESVSIDLNAAVVSQMNSRFAVRASMQLFHVRLHGDVRESDGPAGPLSMTFFFSLASWMDVWLGYQLSSTADGVFAGIAGRFW